MTNQMALIERAEALQGRLLNESLELFGSFVDPHDAFSGHGGEMWTDLQGAKGHHGAATHFGNEDELDKARQICRELAFTNEFAINGAENRISYVVGTGHTYTATQKADTDAGDKEIAAVQQVVDSFIKANHWHLLQQEIMRRRDRDGETFIRLFEDSGELTLRFIEPGQVRAPLHPQPWQTWGVETEPDDVMTLVGYWVDGTLIEADEIQHRKLGVDCNVKRGVPLFWAVHQELKRIVQLQRNMDAVAGIQTAIAMIRRHDSASASNVSTFASALATGTTRDPVTNVKRNYEQYPGGSIIDSPKSIEYEFPSAGIDASRFVIVKQSALRAVASRLSMPEFMLSAKSDDVNYASALVAEGPAVKMFERLQAEQEHPDLDIIHRAITVAARAGLLPDDVLDTIAITVGLPRVQSRDTKVEAETNDTYLAMRVKSRQTISAEIGLDYAQEQENLAADELGVNDFPQLTLGADDDDDEGE